LQSNIPDEAVLPPAILRYFYVESANAIKIQIWVTLIANLLLMVIQKRIRRTWSFSGLATMFRIMLMYYVNCYTFFEEPEKDWLAILKTAAISPIEKSCLRITEIVFLCALVSWDFFLHF
jgi:hypothetical protein